MMGTLRYAVSLAVLATAAFPQLAAAQATSAAQNQAAKAAAAEKAAADRAKAEAEKARADAEREALEELLRVQLKIKLNQLPGGPPQPAPQAAPGKAVPAPTPATAVAQAKDLARRIDALIDKKLKSAKVEAAPLAGDSEFFRRLHLDLAGQIPTLLETRDFVDDEAAGKRAQWIETLLEDEHFAAHFSHVWASIMLSNRAEAELIGQRQAFERWLQDRLRLNQRYDVTAKEVIELVRKPGEFGQPNAFVIYHGNKPEEQTGAVARVFLGVRIECAQCHPHPFADWTKQQFWEFAAFLDPQGVRPAGNGTFLRPQIAMPGKGKQVKAKFLDGSEPPENLAANPKTTLANWITSRDNPYFAKAAADNVWGYFFGASLLEPLLEKEKDKSAATFPELLDLLAKELADHDFDLKHLVRAIVYTNAYQRTSKAPGKADDQLALFGRMPVRALSADQLFDSFLVATNSKTFEPTPNNQLAFNNFNPGAMTERTKFLLKFYDTARATESTTSILQALFLMNGKFVNERIDPKANSMLPVLASTAGNSKRQVETLYLLVLSRPPSAEEAERLGAFVESGGANADRAQALSDVLWALLNSSEFALNH